MRGLLGDILTEQYQVTIADMEAGLEHMSRSEGTIAHVDAVVIVLEPYRKALETARRTVALARQLEIPHILGGSNKVRDDDDLGMLHSFAADNGLNLVSVIPYDEAARAADRDGTALIDLDPRGPAVRAVDELLDAALALTTPGAVSRSG